jgi:regulator of sigma E protease
MVVDYVKQLKLIFSPKTKGYEQLGSFLTIGSIFPSTWDWQAFWSLTAFLSVILAIMNILPIPALDGGHVMFLLYEIVTGRKPGDKFMEYAQITGMVILIGLMLFANFNDVMRFFFK